MHPVISQLITDGVVLTDGAWGTELQARGLASGDVPDAWNLLYPERVAAVAEAYVASGSRIILTNTFGANRLRLDTHRLADQVQPINRRGVEISKRAAAGRALVFASIGPSGRVLFSEEVTESELTAAFDEQATALAAAGADGLVVETMADLREAQIAVAVAHATGLPVVACMVFGSGKHRDRTTFGVSIQEAVAGLMEVGADVIGANCGQGIEGMVDTCCGLRASGPHPIWIKANAGLPELVNGQAVYRTTADAFARVVPELVGAGANFIGGCCGTDPSFIRAIRQIIDAEALQ